MALPRVQPMPERQRFRIAGAVSLAVHLVLLLLIGRAAARPPEITQPPEPIAVSFIEAPLPEVGKVAARSVQLRPEGDTPKVPAVKIKSAPSARPASNAGGKAKAAPEPTYDPGSVDGPLPTYPKAALDRGWEGTTTLSVTVGPGGEVTAVEVAESSGQEALDQAAARALRKGWTFKPGMAKGKPVAGKVTVIFSFSNGEVSKG